MNGGWWQGHRGVPVGSLQGHRRVKLGGRRSCAIRIRAIEKIVFFSTAPFSRNRGVAKSVYLFDSYYPAQRATCADLGAVRRGVSGRDGPRVFPVVLGFRAPRWPIPAPEAVLSPKKNAPTRVCPVVLGFWGPCGTSNRRGHVIAHGSHRVQATGAAPLRGAGSPSTTWVSRATARIPRPWARRPLWGAARPSISEQSKEPRLGAPLRGAPIGLVYN